MERKTGIRTIELLAPASNAEAGRAAIDHGADAIYIGGPAFGARRAAGNSIEQIAQLVEYARPFGVRTYVALNTLIWEEELDDARRVAQELIGAGVDALIIQDMAFMRMGLEGVEFHSSTQMCNHSPEQVRFLRESGFSRVILERGLTMDEIRTIRQVEGVELECFIHGAICVGYSGQCYMSRSMNSRSGNRGDCSQPCRLTYDLLDGQGREVISSKHLLSVMDLNLSERIPQLIDAGIGSFKIEGRLKDANYIKNVVAHYRQVIDAALHSRPGVTRSSSGRHQYGFTPDPSRTFSRGSTTWMLDGKRRGVASFSTPKAMGEYVGEVTATGRDFFEIGSATKLHPGDGICFFAGDTLMGTNINKADGNRIYPNKPEGLTRGVKVYRNYDKLFAGTLEGSRTRRVIDVSAHLRATCGEIALTLADTDGNSITATQAGIFEHADDAAKMEQTMRTQLAKLGDTIFAAHKVDVEFPEGAAPFVQASTLNGLRRRAATELLQKRIDNPPPRNIPGENRSFPYPSAKLGGEANVANSLSREFYHDHGVTDIAEPIDKLNTLSGQRIMTSAYCLRRELGQCLKETTNLQGPLRLRRGAITWQLDFDCAACRMTIIKD